jgi:hypothetical protein
MSGKTLEATPSVVNIFKRDSVDSPSFINNHTYSHIVIRHRQFPLHVAFAGIHLLYKVTPVFNSPGCKGKSTKD